MRSARSTLTDIDTFNWSRLNSCKPNNRNRKAHLVRVPARRASPLGAARARCQSPSSKVRKSEISLSVPLSRPDLYVVAEHLEQQLLEHALEHGAEGRRVLPRRRSRSVFGFRPQRTSGVESATSIVRRLIGQADDEAIDRRATPVDGQWLGVGGAVALPASRSWLRS